MSTPNRKGVRTMKKLFFAIIFLAVSVSSSTAQMKQEQPPQPGTTRIAVVNIGLVFNKYERAKAFKKELEDLIRPYQAKGKALRDELDASEKELATPGLDPAKKERLEAAVLRNKRQLEDLQRE